MESLEPSDPDHSKMSKDFCWTDGDCYFEKVIFVDHIMHNDHKSSN